MNKNDTNKYQKKHTRRLDCMQRTKLAQIRFERRTLKTRRSPQGLSADLLCTDAQAATQSEQGGPPATNPCGWSLTKTMPERRRHAKEKRGSERFIRNESSIHMHTPHPTTSINIPQRQSISSSSSQMTASSSRATV